VLITLAIIGIIAAITIPSIVANHQKTALEAQFAKNYRTVSQMVNLAIAEFGGIETWDWKESYTNEEMDEFVKKYFLPYLNVARFCPAQSKGEGCMPNTRYKQPSGVNYGDWTVNPFPGVLLADGSFIQFYFKGNYIAAKNKSLDLNIDINGAKKPNMRGVDWQMFGFYPQTGEFLPFGVYKDRSYNEQTKSYEKYSKEELYASCADNKPADGVLCAARIIQDGFKINYNW